MTFPIQIGFWILVGIASQSVHGRDDAAGATWSDAVFYRLPEDFVLKGRVTRAAQWLKRHIFRVQPSGQGETVAVIAWKDPTLEPEVPTLLAAYVITDTLWAAKALKPVDPVLSHEMEAGIRHLGWYGNGLHDVLFHRLDKILHCPADEDFVHGHSLGKFAVSGGETLDLRVFRQKWDPAFDVGHPIHFTEHAVYRALHDFWHGRKSEARRRIRETIEDNRAADPQDQLFWDGQTRTIVDYVNRNEWITFTRGERPECRHYTFKLGVLLYAIRVMGMEAEVPIEGMKERLWSAQMESGGVAHFVDVRFDGTATPGLDSTGEASAIAILAETVVPPKQ
jgi:hypothetical protein